MNGVHVFIFLVLLPFLAALGHDMWISYETSALQEIKFVSVGFVWTNYSPESFKWAAENLDQIYWDILNKVLPMKTSVITGILPAVALSGLLILRIFCIWPFQELATSASRKIRKRR